jgi:hypothetical protein
LQWTAVPLAIGGDGPPGTISATADLAVLEGRFPHAVRLAWPLGGTTVGHDDDMCCVCENDPFQPVYTKDDDFSKTGSGQTWRKLKKEGRFLR